MYIITNTHYIIQISAVSFFLGFFLMGEFTLFEIESFLYLSFTCGPWTLHLVSTCALAVSYFTAVNDWPLASFNWLKMVTMALPFAHNGII